MRKLLRRVLGAKTAGPAPASFVRDKHGERPSVAICLHLFYLDLWPEISEKLGALDRPFDLLVSLPSQEALEKVEPSIREVAPNACLWVHPNRGRDIAPFVRLLNSGALKEYELICKIHSKRSAYSEKGDHWRSALMDPLIGDPQSARQIVEAFARRPEVGLVGPCNSFLTADKFWGGNRERVERLARKIGWTDTVVPLAFFAGSMFWFRPAALEPLVGLGIKLDDFEEECGAQDATLAHAIERLPCLSAWIAKFEVTSTDLLHGRIQDQDHSQTTVPVLG